MEITTHGGGELLYYILNGVAAITQGSNYADLVAITLAFGIIWIGLRAAFGMSSLKESALFFFGFLIFYQALLIPKVTILLSDKFDTTYNATIDNVPYGIAMIGGYTSTIGNGITELMDQAYSLPNDQSYSKNGFLFGSKIIQQASALKIRDVEFASNMSKFVQQCVFYDIYSANKYTVSELKNTDDIWDLITVQNAPSSVMMLEYETDGQRQIVTCLEGATLLETKWTGEIEERMVYLYERNLGKADTNAVAVSYITSSLQNSNEFLMGLSKDATVILKQNLMINAVNNAAYEYGSNSLAEYADLIANEETKSAFARTGAMAQKWIPIVKTAYEALLYGIFPVMFLMFLLPGGTKIFIDYIKTFIWVQLWAPIYAVLHLMLSLCNRYELEFASGEVTMANYQIISQVTQDIGIVAGYLMMSIPFIALKLLSGLSTMGYMAGSLLAIPQAAAQNAAGEMTRGNYSAGNTSFDNHSYNNMSANKRDSISSIQSEGGQLGLHDGSRQTITGSGKSYIDQSGMQSHTVNGLSQETNLGHELRDSATNARSIENQLRQEENKGLTSSLNQMSNFSHMMHQGKESGQGFNVTTNAETQQAFEDYDNTTKQIAGRAGVNLSNATEGSFGFKIGSNGLENKTVLLFDGGASAELTKREEDSFKDSLSIISQNSKAGHFNITDSDGKSLNQDFNTSYDEYQQLSQARSEWQSNADTFDKQASQYENTNFKIERELSSEFYSHLVDRKDEGGAGLTVSAANKVYHDRENFRHHSDQFIKQKFNTDFDASKGKGIIDTIRNKNNDYNPDNFKHDPQKFDYNTDSLKTHGGIIDYRSLAQDKYDNEKREGLDQSHLESDFNNKLANNQSTLNGKKQEPVTIGDLMRDAKEIAKGAKELRGKLKDVEGSENE